MLAAPQTIHKPNSSLSTDLQTFEEIYKTSYSHGLETIYGLENIDIKSVRRIEIASKNTPKRFESKKTQLAPTQEELDLGPGFHGWISPFVKKEPIHVLELTRHAEKCLIDNSKSKLGDLIGANLKDFVFLRGMGQGHIEEIQHKLNTYLEGQALEKSHKINFSSWLKSLVAAQERKKVYALLETYELESRIPLNSGESVEVRKLTLEKKFEWIEELLNKITLLLGKK